MHAVPDRSQTRPSRWIALTAVVAMAAAAAVWLGARRLHPALVQAAASDHLLWTTLASVALLSGVAGLAASAAVAAAAARRIGALHESITQLGEPLDLASDRAAPDSEPSLDALLPLERAVADARRRMRRVTDSLAGDAARAQALVDLSPDALFAMDGGGRIIAANSAAEGLFRRPREVLLGSVLPDMLALESLQVRVDALGTLQVDDAWLATRFTTSLRLFGRPAVAAEVAIVPLPMEGERAWAVVVHDLTAERQAAAALEEARRAAEIANGARMLFLGRMSHELRSPLGSITSLLGSVRRSRGSQLGERDRTSLDRAQEASEELLTLVSDILDLVQLESGGMALVLADTDVAPIVSEVLAQFEDAVAGRPLLLEADLPGVPAIAAVDAARLRQVLTHLVDNAVKFTARGSVQVSVHLDHATGRASAILVRDTGIGIPLALQSSIFEKFAQGDQDVNQRYGGTGLGLALSRGIAQQMRCALSVESVPGAGSTFTLTFAPALSQPQSPVARPAFRRTPLSGITL